MDYRPDATDNVELFIFSSGARPATHWPLEIERRGHIRSQFSSHILVILSQYSQITTIDESGHELESFLPQS